MAYFNYDYSKALACIALVTGLGGCVPGGASDRPAWSFYDACSQKHSSFTEVASCGKNDRLAYCSSNNSCSDNGNNIVAYADSLASSVRSRELSDPEARRKWIEFRNNTASTARREQLQARSIAAQSTPVTCTTSYGVTNCF